MNIVSGKANDKSQRETWQVQQGETGRVLQGFWFTDFQDPYKEGLFLTFSIY